MSGVEPNNTNTFGPGAQHQNTGDRFDEAVNFLEQLRPGGPWVLTAIIPDKLPNEPPTITSTAHSHAEIESFCCEHNGKRNLYYSVNPTKTPMSKKASKADIAAIEYLLGDLDPKSDETSEQAKARYLKELETFEPRATATIDSGNGIQGLWKLGPIIPLGNGSGAIIADVEARSAALMERLGAKAGTQNIDRILRLPGTINLPNAVKRKVGRVECPTKLIMFNGASYSLDSFPLAQSTSHEERAAQPEGEETRQNDEEEDWDKLERIIRNGEPHGDARGEFGGDRNRAVWWVICEMFRRGYSASVILSKILDRTNKISDHVYAQNNPPRYAEKQVRDAKKKITFSKDDEDGKPHKTQANIHIALLKMGVALRYDQFADRTLIEGLPDFGPVLDDAACDRIWLLFDQRFKLQVAKDFARTVILDTALLNRFHPVRDYLNAQEWDGVERIDRWLTTYGGVEDNKYSRAVGQLFLTAAVHRVRSSGCKFDEMVVLEQEVQGTDKSTALSTLAVRDEWFSDDLPLNVEGKQVIEALRGRWIVEAGEMSGMKRTDIAHIKALLSRQVDRARLAYGRIVSEVPRQCVIVGLGTDGSGQCDVSVLT